MNDFRKQILCDIKEIYERLVVIERRIHEVETTCCGEPNECLPVVITAQPDSPYTVTEGDPIILNVNVKGSQPYTFQWKKDNVDIDGATGSSYTIAVSELEDAGEYTVTITNDCGSVVSETIVVVVEPFEVKIFYYWGFRDSIDEIVTGADVEALGYSNEVLTGTDLECDFTDNVVPKILIMGEPVTEPVKTRWYGSQFNNSTIGNPDTDLFGPYVIIGDYRVYYTVYPTQQNETTIIFQID